MIPGLLAPGERCGKRGAEQSSRDLWPKDKAENGLLGATFDASDINRNINENELQGGSLYASKNNITENLIKGLI